MSGLNRLLKWALIYAERGWYVFPLVPGSKIAAKGSHGLKDASIDESVIRAWWAQTPNANIGFNCGRSGIVVLDVDTKAGKVGGQSLFDLIGDDFTPIETLSARTWSGGSHYFYRGTAKSQNSVLAQDLDIKAEGGHVVLPPSIVSEGGKTGTYRWNNAGEKMPLLDFPDIFRPKDKPRSDPMAAVSIITGGRNSELTRIAGKYRRIGMSPSAIEAALHIDNKQRCSPPLPDNEIMQIAKHAGAWTPEPERRPDVTPVAGVTYEPISFAEMRERSNLQQMTWAIENTVPRAGIMLMSALPGAGKSDLARNVARSIALGTEWLGRKCAKGSVLWLGLEEPLMTLLERVEVMKLDELPIKCVRELPPGEQVQWLDGILTREKYDVVIIDTLSHFFSGIKDINDYSAVSVAGRSLFALREKHNTTFILLHHNNKTNAPLGSVQLLGMVDTVMLLSKSPEGTYTARTDKVRLGLDMEPTVLTMDPDTGFITTAEPAWRAQQRIAEQAIVAYLVEHESATRHELANNCGRRASIGRQAVDALVSQGLLKSQGKGTKAEPKTYFLPKTPRSLFAPTLPENQKPTVTNVSKYYVPDIGSKTGTYLPELPENVEGSEKGGTQNAPRTPRESPCIPENPELPENPEESLIDYAGSVLG
jgi:hypothetical protein